MKPSFIDTDKTLNKVINKFIKLYKIEKSSSLKTVDLNNIHKTCNLDFEIELVQRKPLPASDHQIGHINIGGLIIPGQTPHYTNKWTCTIGVVIKNNSQNNSVYSLMYNLASTFNKNTLIKDSGLDLSSIDERDLVNYFFYTELLRIYNEEILPIKAVKS